MTPCDLTDRHAELASATENCQCQLRLLVTRTCKKLSNCLCWSSGAGTAAAASSDASAGVAAGWLSAAACSPPCRQAHEADIPDTHTIRISACAGVRHAFVLPPPVYYDTLYMPVGHIPVEWPSQVHPWRPPPPPRPPRSPQPAREAPRQRATRRAMAARARRRMYAPLVARLIGSPDVRTAARLLWG